MSIFMIVVCFTIAAPAFAADTFQDKLRSGGKGPLMVVVPAGTFEMGSPHSEDNRDPDEGPVHTVRIAKKFAVGVYEVTVSEFAVFVQDAGYGMKEDCYFIVRNDKGNRELSTEKGSWQSPGRYKAVDDGPVSCVNWNDAKAYVEWLSKQTGAVYRLLSESEWEYAARAGTKTRYYFGDTIKPRQANFDSTGFDKPVLVGSFPPNAFGVHDMHGNLWEWVEDCWHDTYARAPADGSAWVRGGDCSKRVLRGGSWFSDPEVLRSANRFRITSDNRYNFNGFRIARTLP